MPFTDLIRNLNLHSRPRTGGLHSSTRFVAEDGKVFVHYAGLRLESRFLPYVETAGGRQLGHAAALLTTGLNNRLQLQPGAVFALPTDAAEFIYLDRLVRTLHALNYQLHPAQGNLLLKVHGRHIASVADEHGLAFEEILRPCGLVPAQITLEIQAGGSEDTGHLKRAVANYQARGYGIALTHIGHEELDSGLLQDIAPDIVRIVPAPSISGRPLRELVARLRAHGVLVMAEGEELSILHPDTRPGDIDLLLTREGRTVRARTPAKRLLQAAA